MAEVTTKRTGELLRGVFKILLDAPDGMRGREVLCRLEKDVPPTSFEAREYPNSPGIRRYENIVRFSTVTCVKAGWLEKSKGNWRLTEAGVKAYRTFSDPEQFKRESVKLYRRWAETNFDNDMGKSDEVMDKPVNVTLETADEQAWAEIERHIEAMDPYDFQNRLVAGLLRGMGYHVAHMAPPGADGGVDIVAYSDPLGTKEPTIKVSVRRRAGKADVKDVREFLSRLHGGEVGIFISVAGFTSEAEKECRAEQRKIRLIDLEKLFNLWVEHYNQIAESERKMLPLKPVWFLAVDETQ